LELKLEEVVEVIEAQKPSEPLSDQEKRFLLFD
jgi:hypothetical protein